MHGPNMTACYIISYMRIALDEANMFAHLGRSDKFKQSKNFAGRNSAKAPLQKLNKLAIRDLDGNFEPNRQRQVFLKQFLEILPTSLKKPQ